MKETEVLEELELNNVRRILDEYCNAFKNLYKGKLENDGKSATGNLIQSIETSIKISGSTINIVLNVADYFQWVENGRNPGKFPPIAAIKQWIHDKPIIPEERNGKLPTEDQLAFLIGRKIAEEGIKPGNQLKDTISELNDIYIERLKAALSEDFGVYQIKILQDINRMIKI